MDKEEILRRSRAENQNKDIYELEVTGKAQRAGGLVAICVAFALMVIESVLLDSSVNYAYFLIILSAGMVLWLYKAVKMRKKHEMLLAVIWTALTIYAAVMVVLGFRR
ncbi:MAG: hypothetical protein HFH68_06020 [Lachnospiraceae bacterium]|nr:hypothetical protein [Lachnospiraceae bacterium]